MDPNGFALRAKRAVMDQLPRSWARTLRRGRGKVTNRVKKRNKASARLRKRAAIIDSQSRPLDQRKVFYESFDGHGASCNPFALYRHLRRDSRFDGFTHVWSISDLDEYSSTVGSLRADGDVVVVKHGSPEYFEQLHTAGYVISNSTFPHEYTKRRGQIYLNTWHGIPLKQMGYHTPDGRLTVRNVMRNFLAATYLHSASPYMTSTMYEDAYRLNGVFGGEVLEYQQPRMDLQRDAAADRIAVIEELSQHGLQVDPEKKIVIYAPTWKGASVYSPVNDIDRLHSLVEELKESLGRHDYQIFIKAHQLVYRQGVSDPVLKEMLIPNAIHTNTLLGITDVLITDYSSLFIDFLERDRPILFHVPDAASYEEFRGLYSSIEELPGVVTRTVPGLAEALSGALDEAVELVAGRDVGGEHTERRRAWAAEHIVPLQGETASGAVIDAVFGSGPSAVRKFRLSREDKTSLLIHVGGLLNNGITRAAHNLLANIDYDRYDVTVSFPYSSQRDRVANAMNLDPRARTLPRVGFTMSSGDEQRIYEAFVNGEQLTAVERAAVVPIIEREYRRMFGEASFDVVIDFDGYSPLYAVLFSQAGDSAKIIWAHNDLPQDSQRQVNGKKVFGGKFESIISCYRDFDVMASVNVDLSHIHAEAFADYFSADGFVPVQNFIDVELILEMARGGAQALPSSSDTAEVEIVCRELGPTLQEVGDLYGWDAVLRELEKRRMVDRIVQPQEGFTNFVTAARLSPEKNQELLLRAFEKVHRENPYTRLIILGTGPLEAALKSLTHALGIANAVKFAGQQANPFAIFDASDCFVFSSLYEGQGLALMEAVVLGVPVVTTEYNVVRSVLPEGVGLITPPTADGLAEGMQAYLDGKVPVGPFDSVTYNRVSREQFDAAVTTALQKRAAAVA